MEFTELMWNRPFHPAYGIVSMASDTYVYYRGYKTMYKAVSDRPAYYGTLEDANTYASTNDRELAAFTNKKTLRLMDIRFMKALLRELFSLKDDSNTYSVVLSFGICSLFHQCKLASQRFKDPQILPSLHSLLSYFKESNYEQQGFRVAETTNDAYSMAFLAKLFEDFADGFFSPRQFSPFHKEKTNFMLNAEFIVFNPEKSGIVKLDTFPKVRTRYVESLYTTYGKGIRIGDMLLHVHSGGSEETEDEIPVVERISEMLNYDPVIQSQWEKGTEAGKLWKEIAEFKELEGPHPHCRVSDWITDMPKQRQKKLFTRRYTVRKRG